MKSLAPTIGGGIGAGVGSIGGIPGAVAGGTLGAGAGQLIHELDRNKEAQQTISALTQGDVEKLVSIQMQEHKSWFSKALDGLKSILLFSDRQSNPPLGENSNKCAPGISYKFLQSPPAFSL